VNSLDFRSNSEDLAHQAIDYGHYSDQVRAAEATPRTGAFFIFLPANTPVSIDMGAYSTIRPHLMDIFSRGMSSAQISGSTTPEETSSEVQQEIELGEEELLLQQLDQIELPDETEQWFNAFVGQLRLPTPVDLSNVYREMESFYGSRDTSGH